VKLDKDVTSNIQLLSNRISRGETTSLAVAELAITAQEPLVHGAEAAM
jgi:hypothetical protein